MTNNEKTTDARDEGELALVPKLRFPEFRHAKGWAREKLGPKTKKVGSGITPTGGEKNYKSSGRPFVRSQNIGWGELLLADVAFIDEDTHNSFRSTQIDADDVLLNITGASIGRSAVADSRIEGGNVNQHVCIIRVTPDELSPSFLNQYLISHEGQKQIDSFQAGGNRQGLNFEQIRSFLLPLPSALGEQQKIAECLNSVDEVIAAQARKVDALKNHKKALMQQLFPREGETQPRVRFAEFQNEGEWAATWLGKHVEIQSGSSPSSYSLSSKGKHPFVKVEDLNNCIKYQSFAREFSDDSVGVVPAHSILFPKRGASIALNKIRITATEILIDTNLMALTPHDRLTPEFLYYYLTNIGLSQIADTSTIPQINNKHITPFGLLLPAKAEQEYITSCLSSLDAMITAETRKLEALKRHKRGLMPQLFPSLVNAEA